MNTPHIVILGTGPAGLGAAYHLARRRLARVTVLDANDHAGGIAGSFSLAGIGVDYGSHRLHPACDPEVLQDIRTLLGDDLLDRPRHGRIRLQGRWIHFPLRPLDLLLRLPPDFALGVMADSFLSAPQQTGPAHGPATYASVLQTGLGRTICESFYFPYGRKLWGIAPEQLSANQAKRRVAAGSRGKMVRKVLSALPGLKSKGSGRFFYPRHGFGQICDAYAQAAAAAGADIRLNARVTVVEERAGAVSAVHYEHDGQDIALQADHVWSTIPITSLVQSLRPAPSAQCLHAAATLRYRAMVLVYLVLDQDQFSEYDAHYFPESSIPISRLSEPKNYSNSQEPHGVTVLCAELPCDAEDAVWSETDVALAELVCAALEQAAIPVRAKIKQTAVRRLRHAYPIYRQGYEAQLATLEQCVSTIDGLLTFGRQGLFAHDNIHHALSMGYAAADCLDEHGGLDHERWQALRRRFEMNVVVD